MICCLETLFGMFCLEPTRAGLEPKGGSLELTSGVSEPQNLSHPTPAEKAESIRGHTPAWKAEGLRGPPKAFEARRLPRRPKAFEG